MEHETNTSGGEARFFANPTIQTWSEAEEPFNVERARERLLDKKEFHFHARVKASDDSDDENRLIEGMANTKSLDLMGEIVEPGAFKRTLPAWMKNPVILVDHIPSISNIVGKATEAKISDAGLFIKAALIKGTVKAEEAWTLIQQGVLKAFSIGYRVTKDELVEVAGKQVRKITGLELFEVSLVAIPANRESFFSLAKGIMYGTDLWVPADGGVATHGTIEDTNNENVYDDTLKTVREINKEVNQGLALRMIRST